MSAPDLARIIQAAVNKALFGILPDDDLEPDATDRAIAAAVLDALRGWAVDDDGQLWPYASEQGVGNCGYIDPLTSLFEDDLTPAPWWVPLMPAATITPIQAWAAFLCWWCHPRMYLPGQRYPNRNPAFDRWNTLVGEVTYATRHPDRLAKTDA